jgi:sorbitol-specific phosphotransferase system component IIC
LLGLTHKLWNKYKIGSTAKNSEYTSKHRGTICLAVGSTGLISVRYQLHPCAVSWFLAKLNVTILSGIFGERNRNVLQI